MSAVDLVASTVMNAAAAAMNDSARVTYTYAAQLPYLRMALQELQEYFELNSIPVTEDVSAVIEMDAGQTTIVYNGVGVPTLPSDLINPKQLWESGRGLDQYIPMTKLQFLPQNWGGVQTSQFIYYVWQKQQIKVLAANQDNDIKIDYVRDLFPDIPNIDENSQINVINASSFLAYRTAALMAELIERNKPSADALNGFAGLALDRATGIESKGKQSIVTRRKPFRQGWKNRTGAYTR